jgi:cytochrome b561
MTSINIWLITLGLFFIATLVSGMVLKKNGHPYSKLKISLHKFSALIVVLTTVVAFIKIFNENTPRFTAIVLIAIIAIMYLILFASGSIMSRQNHKTSEVVLLLHKIITIVVLAISITTFFYLQ